MFMESWPPPESCTGVQGGLQGMLRVLDGQFLRDILEPAGVKYSEIVHKSRWAALEARSSWKARKHHSSGPGSFRCARAGRMCTHAACVLIAAG